MKTVKLTNRILEELARIYEQEESKEPEVWLPSADELIEQSPTGTLKGRSL